MNYALEVDAVDILGVSQDATLQQIHEAYRIRAKKHHPDVGGDEWAFRAVSRAYELLSNARLRHRLVDCWPWVDAAEQEQRQEASTEEGMRDPTEPPPRHTPAPPDHESSWVRAGVEDHVDDPRKLIDIELFTIRFELGSPLDLLGSPEDRNLSSCLTLTWPTQPHHEGELEIEPDPALLKQIRKVFEVMPRKTKATASWSTSSGGQFQGWLNFPTANLAGRAFELVHAALREKGLGVRQLTREMFIARESR